VGILVFKVITLRIEVLSARRRISVKDQGGGLAGLRVTAGAEDTRAKMTVYLHLLCK
jgi:hypothetical protein